MAIDYNDPMVAEEFANVQTMDFDDVVEELLMSGVTAPPTMGDMDVKLMLVELRTMMKKGNNPKRGAEKYSGTPPDTFSTLFEEKLWTKPFFAEMYESVKADGDPTKANVIAEYGNDPEKAKIRYSSSYPDLLVKIEEALNKKKEITSPKITFRGFPSNMGEAGIRMTLQALGEIEEFSCTEVEDFPVLEGEVTFGDVDTAKKAIEQYDGMDMGMGEKLAFTSV